MLRTKKADRIAAFFTAVMLIAAVCLWGIAEPVQGDGSHEIGYESLLFDSSRVHTIEITMDDWDELIANATAEEYRQCDITIDGEKIGTVGIRAKGNTSLSSVATLGSERYSFKIEFDQYAKGKTYHGLDKLSLNNMIQDATMMKDYLSYTLMNEMGVPSSLCSYAMVSVNGEAWGLYLAVEAVEDSFLERNGMAKGELYKPDSLSFGGGRGNGRDFDIENFREKDEDSTEETVNSSNEEEAAGTTTETSGQTTPQDGSGFGGSSGMPAGDGAQQMPQGGDFTQSGGESAAADFTASSGDSAQQMPQGDFAPSGGESASDSETGESAEETPGTGTQGFPSAPGGGDFSGGGFGGFNFGMGSDDVKLVYTDDDPDSYSNIFNNAKTKLSKKDKTRLIESLKKLNEKEDLDSVVNQDEVITYLAVHNFLCNDDSYTGMMVHNYYLYEESGKLTIIPWDYNLGFGGFAASADATSTVNSPIDNPVSNGTTESRPLIAWIFSDEESLEAYHETYDRFISEYVESGWLEEEISRVQEMISSYVENDPTAFYSTEEFEKAVSTLKTFCAKRGESIRGQLDGTIPSTTNEQRSSNALIDASDISTADMGSMNSTSGGGMPSGMPDMSQGGMPSGMPSEMPTGMPDGTGGFDFGGSAGSSGESASESPAAPSATPAVTAAMPETAQEAVPDESTEPAAKEQPAEDGATERPNPPEGGFGSGGFSGGGFSGGGFPGGGDFPGGNYAGGGYSPGIWIWTAACAAALLALILIIRKAGSHNN